jgi:hypothetical protein
MLVAEYVMLIPHSIACGVTSVPPQTIALHCRKYLVSGVFDDTPRLEIISQWQAQKIVTIVIRIGVQTYPSASSELPISDTKSIVFLVRLEFRGFFISEGSAFFNS